MSRFCSEYWNLVDFSKLFHRFIKISKNHCSWLEIVSHVSPSFLWSVCATRCDWKHLFKRLATPNLCALPGRSRRSCELCTLPLDLMLESQIRKACESPFTVEVLWSVLQLDSGRQIRWGRGGVWIAWIAWISKISSWKTSEMREIFHSQKRSSSCTKNTAARHGASRPFIWMTWSFWLSWWIPHRRTGEGVAGWNDFKTTNRLIYSSTWLMCGCVKIMMGDNHNFSWCDWRVIGCEWYLSCTRFIHYFLHCIKHSFGWLPVWRIPLAFGHFVGSFFLTAITWSAECWNVGRVGTSGGGNPSGTQTSMGRGEEGCGAHDHSENSGFRIAVFEIISSVLDAGMFLCFTVASRLSLSLTKDCEEGRHWTRAHP